MLQKDFQTRVNAVWQLISERGELSIQELTKLVNYKNLFFALGWLCKENKILLRDEDGELFIERNTSVSEIFY
ncbi:MAG: winged helix-turn-helix domain-containing protein [Bacteroidales bacterium]|nr:winged helix-turn-helix domain-containing protein [Bacteroidales bacterium]